MTPSLIELNKLGDGRFTTGAEFDKLIATRTDQAVNRMVTYLPDNYPYTPHSRLSSLFRVFSEENQKMQQSLFTITDDMFHADTRPEYLYQILGDLLFIGPKAGGVQYTDASYRDFLIKVRNAYLGGSSKANIQKSLSEIIGIPVDLRELYLEARKSNNPLGVKLSNKIVADIYIDQASQSTLAHLSTIIQDLYFFIALIKPAHTLFDTRLIWTDEMSAAHCATEGFGTDPNGNSFVYVYDQLPNSVYSLSKLSIFNNVDLNPQLITDTWIQGVVTSIDTVRGVITLADSSELVISSLSLFYNGDTESYYRIELAEVHVGDTVWFYGFKAPGSFNFYYPVKEVQENWYKQFDPTVIQSPVFQSNVVKVNQFTSDMQDIVKGCDHTLAISEADYELMPMYEDARDNCDYPTPKLYAAYFLGPAVTAGGSGPGYQDVHVYVKATDDPNIFLLAPAPVVSATGELAGVGDLTVYLDGKSIEGAIAAIDPFNGLITLTFIPPANSTLRIDFYYHPVYPRLISQGITRTLPVGSSTGNNVGASVFIQPQSSVQPQVFISKTIKPVVVGPYSNQTFYQLPKSPLLNSSGNLAVPTDLVIKEDGVHIPGHDVQQVFAQYGVVITNFVPSLGVTVTIEYYSMELPHPVIYFQWPFRTAFEGAYGNNMSYQVNLVPMLDKYGDLATVSDVQLYVDGLEVQDGIEYVRPLLGHVQLNFMPPAGSEVTFSYYYQEKPRTYAMISDDPDRLDDTFYGPRSAYTLVSDPIPFVSANSPLDKYNQVAVIGYRYRAFDLGSSSVLNSRDTFRLNDYAKPSIKASFKGTPSKIGNYRVEFSGEFLYDTQKYIVLNDLYLVNGLPALTQLRKGIPPFYRSFNSSGDFIYSTKVTPTDSSYSSSIPGATDIEASVVINSPPSGLVEYVPVPEYPYQERLKVTSGLKEFTTVTGDLDINLTSMCDERGFDLGLYPKEEYYPNRELRLNDYKDYLNRLTSYSYSGSMFALQGSDIIKSNGLSWKSIRRGSYLKVGDFEYAVASIPNENTIKLSRAFHQDSGEYDYTIYYQYVNHVDVLLNNVIRRKLVNIQALIPAYAGMTGSSFYAPWIIDTAFADPDPDPYPRNAYIYPVGSTPPAPPLLTSEIGNQNGEQGLLLSEEEASKMVKFRNWDQELFVVVPFSGLLQEPITEAMDDLSDGTRMLFWNVAKQDFQEFVFKGTIIATSTQVGSFSAADYPNGVIRLSSAEDNVGLDDPTYILLNTVVHQIMPDNSVDIVAIDEFVRIPQGALYLDNSWYLDGSLILSGI